MKNKDLEQQKKKTPVQQLQEKPGKNEFLIVGMGASAGGIQSLKEFFMHVPADSGMAYVVILHLSPDHDSKLAEILQSVTKIPVTQVKEKTHIKPNHVYVVPPNQHLTMNDGSIIVSPNTQVEERRAPVDIFFRTLADEHGPRAICVVLSGTGANGSMGLKRIKERGGAAFVQNPREAEFNEMPRNSIATELVDEVLPVADIPAKIIAYKTSLGTVHISEEAHKSSEEQQQALREIFTQIKLRTGHDFTNYKRPTLLRRLERRINIRNLPDLPAYAAFLEQHPDEANALLKDLLISVTNFFRDKKAFEVIEHEILPVLMRGKKMEDLLRIWVAGCATGEEAYSIAMLLAEKTMGIIDAPKIQIFATDIDLSAIAQAREGCYTLNDAADISPERLRRFFNKEGDGYRIRREVRETVMFAHHNFLKDPPFSHLDMVTCRNVMIYLNQAAQERVIETFHFALKPGGYLFLGSSESVDGATDMYAVYNRENHIFQSRQTAPRVYPMPEPVPGFYFDKLKPVVTSQENKNKILNRISFGDLHQQLLEEYAPPSIVINEEYDIVHLTERAGRYLQIAGGELSHNLLKLVKPELRLELRSALYQAVQCQSAVESGGLKVSIEDKTETVNIHIHPVLRAGDTARGFILVLFEPTMDEGRQSAILLASDEPVARHLEEELTRLKTQLRSSNEQHEFQAEELKASNEELQAMNEELRSAAEELETSKEELQSINEELRTVNQELKVKIEETSITGNNLRNLINSTDIGTVFLDRSFRVVLFTPAAREIFNLIPADYGRPLSDITSHLEYDDLLKDAETVLHKLNLAEREVRTKDGRAYLMRVSPYRTDDDRIKGVVISFVNITQRKLMEETLHKSEEHFRAVISQTISGIAETDLSGRFTFVNERYCRIVGYTQKELLSGMKMQDFTSPEDLLINEDLFKRLVETGEPFEIEKRYVRKDGSLVWVHNSVSAIRDAVHRPQFAVAVVVDITERKRLEQQKEEFLSIASHELKTPVTSIKAYGELLQEVLGESEKKESGSLIQKLNAQVNRLNDLISDLLDTTKISEGQLVLNYEKFNLNALMRERVEELSHLSPKHNLVILPLNPVMITADCERIGQALSNLISNAVKYSPEGGDITIACEAFENEVMVSIADTGIGIPEELQEKVFTRFFRVHHAQTNLSPGMGLGLYITAGIIHRHGGKIRVESNPGKGSVFYFTLPYNNNN